MFYIHALGMEKPFQIVGVLNVTPDSYFDGGKFTSIDVAVERAGQMLHDGADFLEIGGESTGPNSKEVSSEEEAGRVMPVLRAIQESFPEAKLSIDTYKSSVAVEALKLGVTMINDVTAGRSDPAIFDVVRDAGALLVLMYAKDPLPRTTIRGQQYDDVVATVKTFLQQRTEAAMQAGIPRGRLIVDPGMGHFVSSNSRYSFEILAGLEEIAALGFPVFVSPSRKSFLAGPENLKTADRLPGTIAASVIAFLRGATYIRTHDVLEVKRACEIAAATLQRQ